MNPVKPVEYCKKPVIVEAVRFTGSSESASIVRWILDNGGRASYETVDMDTMAGMMSIKTLEGWVYASPGDYIIKDANRFYIRKPDIFEQTYEIPVILSKENRRIIEQAYSDGDGYGIDIVSSHEPPWFRGVYDGDVLYFGMEHNDLLYSVVLESDGSWTVVLGRRLIDNELGVSFPNIGEAKAYVKGLTAK